MNKFQSLVLSIAMAMVLTVPQFGTAKAQGSDCALIGSKAPPLSIVKGFNADWILAFSYQPFINQNCSLDARITINPGFVEFGVLQITAPYSCALPSLTDARCSGTATTRADFSARLHGRAEGQSGITLTINGKTFFYSVFVVSPTKIYLPLINVGRQVGTVKAAEAKEVIGCGTVSFSPSPLSLKVGETKRWLDIFSFSPTGQAVQAGCELTATLTVSPEVFGFTIYDIDLPYNCSHPTAGTLVCKGNGTQMVSLSSYIKGLAVGHGTIEIKVNEVSFGWFIDVTADEPTVPAIRLFMPLAAS